MIRRLRVVVAAVVAATLLCGPPAMRPAVAERVSLVRDAEIEATLKSYATPVFRAAGLDPSSVEIYLVNSKSINAFVAGGQRLFIHTGLLAATDNANQVIGVIAHEVGHIAAAHLARLHDALRSARIESILALVLGAAAGAAAGRADVGAIVAGGGADSAMRSLLAYSRTQEGSADAAAIRFLESTGQSPAGLRDFLRKLEDQELLAAGRQDPYLRTHPLSRDRVQAVDDAVQKSRYAGVADSPESAERHKRMVAKIVGFLEGPQTALRRYPESNSSLEARYARAAAYHQASNLKAALALVDGLIAERPSDPYFHELKGQILFERGRPGEAVESFETAVRLAPDSPLMRLGLARVQLATEDPRLLDAAVGNLRAGLVQERDDPDAWRQLAVAYGRKGRMGESALAMAEEAMLLGKRDEARFQAAKADRLLPAGSPDRLKAQDLLREAQRKKP